MNAPRTFGRFVALGDSTTEGLDDPYPGYPVGSEVYRGWADRLAERLAEDNPDLRYANLAIRGRLIAGIHDEQLQLALAMEPDLVSVVGGVNDLLRPKFDPAAASAHLEAMVSALRERGATVLVMTLPDLSSSMRVAGLVSKRMVAFNDAIRQIARRTGATLVDMANELTVYDPRGWSPDRLHANGVGHEYLMWGAALSLGVPEARERLDELKANAAPQIRRGAVRDTAAEAAWVWEHLRPWIVRRLKGTSSGDGVSAKRPEMLPLLDADLASSQG